MAAPRSINAHVLNPLKGWPQNAALDFSAPISAAALAATETGVLYAGSCVHLDTNGEYALGCEKASALCHMPIFLFPNSDDPDVSNDGGITGTVNDDPDGWAAVKRNNVLGLVATGGYELETTEYIGTPTIGKALKALTSDKGKLAVGTVGTDTVVGIVSRGVKNLGQLDNRTQTLAFWPVCLPVAG